MPEPAFYVTTPIYYISGTPHIGHAYTTIAADVLVRTARAHGPARSLTGTDEHGQKVAAVAAAAGHDADRASSTRWRPSGARSRRPSTPASTTSSAPPSRATRARRWRSSSACARPATCTRASYEGWYCTHDETFWPEAKLIEGRCPNPECRRPVEWLSEKNWFFRLSAYRDRLVEHFRANPEFVRPQARYNEMMAVLEGGLDDLSISRSSFDWGIPLPGGGVLYVWFDALINYISALGWPDDREGLFARFWPGMHLIGKEIARFHTLIWPAMLWSAGLPAPARVFAHGWITIDGEKMSKSLGNVIEPFSLLERFGPDSVRYFLLREAPFGSDFSISLEKLRMRHNSDLGNDLGNLLRRSLAMLQKYRNGLVPEPGRGRGAGALRRLARDRQRARHGAALSRGARRDLEPGQRAQPRDRRPETLGALQRRPRRGAGRAALHALRRAALAQPAAVPLHAVEGDGDLAAARPRRHAGTHVGRRADLGRARREHADESRATRCFRASTHRRPSSATAPRPRPRYCAAPAARSLATIASQSSW